MSNIFDSGFNDCSGCSACALQCPYNAIEMSFNENGFYTPLLHENKCISCGKCKKVCYKFLENKNIESFYSFKNDTVFAVTNNFFEQLDEVTTVGVATRIAKVFYEKGYSIYGVEFDPVTNRCSHIEVEDTSDIDKLKGSKYLQSSCYDGFLKALNNNNNAIIFGTPCQIYGLRKILENSKNTHSRRIILIDLFCVGVPTLNLFKKYKIFLQDNFKLNGIKEINFKDKTQGWHKFSMMCKDDIGNKYRQNLHNDMFFSFFLRKICLNKSCYSCKLRHDSIFSDIRLGDFWGEKFREWDDGVGLVVLNSNVGEKCWNEIKNYFKYSECKLLDVFESQKIDKYNPPIIYNDVIDALKTDETLESIFVRLGVNKYSYNVDNIDK